MRKIESFSNEDDVIETINQLRGKGVKETDMVIVSKERIESSALKFSNAKIKPSTGGMWDKLHSTVEGADPETLVMEKMNLTNQEEEDYRKDLDDGKILLYVNEDLEKGEMYYHRDPLEEDRSDRVDTSGESKQPEPMPDSARTPGEGDVGKEGQPHNVNAAVDHTQEVPKVDKSYGRDDGTSKEIINDDAVENVRNQDVVDTHHDEGLYKEVNEPDDHVDVENLPEDEKERLRQELNAEKGVSNGNRVKTEKYPKNR